MTRYNDLMVFTRGQGQDKWARNGTWIRKLGYKTKGVESIFVDSNQSDTGYRVQYMTSSNSDEPKIYISFVKFENGLSHENTPTIVQEVPVSTLNLKYESVQCPDCHISYRTKGIGRYENAGYLNFEKNRNKWCCSNNKCDFAYTRSALADIVDGNSFNPYNVQTTKQLESLVKKTSNIEYNYSDWSYDQIERSW